MSDFQFQIIALLLEFTGLSLAFIEVRMPKKAAEIARFLAKLASPIQDLRMGSSTEHNTNYRLSTNLSKVFSTVISIGTIPLFVIFLTNALKKAVTDALTLSWLIPQLIVFTIQLIIVTVGLLVVSLFLFFTVAAGSDFATRFVEGRAVGTLGIMLAVIGLAMEVYQLISIV